MALAKKIKKKVRNIVNNRALGEEGSSGAYMVTGGYSGNYYDKSTYLAGGSSYTIDSQVASVTAGHLGAQGFTGFSRRGENYDIVDNPDGPGYIARSAPL